MPSRAVVSAHPGSSEQEKEEEPDWGSGHAHRIGFINQQDRVPGVTHAGEDWEGRDDELDKQGQIEEYTEKLAKARSRIEHGELLNFRDIMQAKTDFHLNRKEDHPPGWRFMIDVTEGWVKTEQAWPANQKAKAQKEEQEKEKDRKGGKTDDDKDQRDSADDGSEANKAEAHGTNDSQKQDASSDEGATHDQGGNPQKGTDHHWSEGGKQDDEENRWRKKQGGRSKTHGAYGGSASDEGYHSGEKSDGDESSEDEELRKRYSPEEISLLRLLRHEQSYIAHLGQNDGKGVSPLAKQADLVDIDVADQFSPDNWIPRSGNLIRQTGKHPLNGEPRLTKLFEAGTITPNELHYVRNHGAVPRLYWETHKLDVENGALVLSMDELEKRFDAVNIPVALACDGNRRGELNLLRRSKGFSWGSGAVSCAYWKGALLRDILLAAGVTAHSSPSKRRYVNFEGSETLSNGKYATSIPLEYAMDPTNDVLIAYCMNDVKLPPDHGFPCRLIIPGYVGGRAVKWLARIWTSDKENSSHYHIWDNRVLPSFITEKDGEFATTMFKHPSTACMEQNLNSIITKPAQGERLKFGVASKRNTYRVVGIAYDGGGHEVQKVELSLDEGETWLYCLRTVRSILTVCCITANTSQFPNNPIRHGNKFWSWLHWHIDIDMGHFLEAKSLTVRCFNVFKNTQPEQPSWNTMGMMNNCWYVVKPQVDSHKGVKGGEAALIFKHPFDPENGEGWIEPSTEVQLQAAKADTGVPDKEFTRQEVEKHSSNGDCWIVINDKVFDATSVLSWHPGGAASILSYAGKLTAETTSSFESIHDDYATKKLNGNSDSLKAAQMRSSLTQSAECALGKLTEKASNFIKESAKAQAQKAAKSAGGSSDVLLQKERWTPVKLIKRDSLSKDTRSYTFQLPPGKKRVGLDTCQHIQFGIHTKDKMLIRSYTPTRPVLASEEDGTFELVIKTYLPSEAQPGGAFSNLIDCMPIGESVDVRGPTGEIRYLGSGKFDIEGKERTFDKVSLILGGSGITPGYQLLERILRTDGDTTQLRVVDANKSEADILLKDELQRMSDDAPAQIKVAHVLSHPGDDWKGLKGHVNAEIIQENCFPPGPGSAVFLCGPPAMIQKAALPALKSWGYEEDENCFGF